MTGYKKFGITWGRVCNTAKRG